MPPLTARGTVAVRLGVEVCLRFAMVIPGDCVLTGRSGDPRDRLCRASRRPRSTGARHKRGDKTSSRACCQPPRRMYRPSSLARAPDGTPGTAISELFFRVRHALPPISPSVQQAPKRSARNRELLKAPIVALPGGLRRTRGSRLAKRDNHAIPICLLSKQLVSQV